MALDDFEAFVRDVDPKLRRALSAHYPREEVSDAVASAFEHAWKHWPRVRTMENPAGYLYRVAQSKSRIRKQGFLPWPDDAELPDFEPRLIPALRALSPLQMRAVWLVHGCGWPHREVAEALEIAPSTVATHVDRALARLRSLLEVPDHA